MALGQVLAGNFINAQDISDELARRSPLYAEKSAAQNLTSNSTALQDVTDLTVPVVTGKKYAGRALVEYQCSTAADLRLAFNFPGGTLDYTAWGLEPAALAVTPFLSQGEASDTIRTFGGAGVAAPRAVTYDIRFTCTSTGSLKLRAAQGTATIEANDQVMARSYIDLHEVGY